MVAVIKMLLYFRRYYIGNLIHRNRGAKTLKRKNMLSAGIFKNGGSSVVVTVKWHKAVKYKIAIEILTVVADSGSDNVVKMINVIYDRGEIPEDYSKYIFI